MGERGCARRLGVALVPRCRGRGPRSEGPWVVDAARRPPRTWPSAVVMVTTAIWVFLLMVVWPGPSGSTSWVHARFAPCRWGFRHQLGTIMAVLGQELLSEIHGASAKQGQ